jgi:hypothetical protein
MQIVCGIEKTDGIHVLRSDDAGLTFTPVAVTGRAGAMMPSVHLRESNGLVRLDVLFLDPTEYGFELHDLRWLDFASGAPILHHVTKAEGFPTAPPPYAGLPFGWRMTGVGWFGYDAVTDGTRIAVIVHEQTIEAYAVYSMLGGPLPPSSGGVGTGSGAATPPPLLLLPGMTGPVPPPNGADHNQLALVVIQ